MKLLSLFDGISCARVALEKEGIEIEEYNASEIDKYAIQIAKQNYPNINHVGSVVGLDCSQFKDIDLLIGGSPCQDLSIAKKDRKGLEGSRSGLFWEYVRILNEVKPKFFVLENVNSMPKEAKATITQALFRIEPVMINAALVSAQNRKRLFWVGRRTDEGYVKVDIPLPEDRGILLKDILEDEVDEKYFISQSECDKVAIKKSAKTFPSGKKEGAIEFPQSVERKALCLLASNPQLDRSTNLIRIDCKSFCLDANYYKGTTVEHFLKYKNRQLVTDLKNIRKLTPIECERLQSLPDNYTKGVSNSQRYKCLGNAFNVEVIAHILKFLR